MTVSTVRSLVASSPSSLQVACSTSYQHQQPRAVSTHRGFRSNISRPAIGASKIQQNGMCFLLRSIFGPRRARLQSTRDVMVHVQAGFASDIPKEKMSPAAEQAVGGHPASSDSESKEFRNKAAETNSKIPGLAETVWGQKGLQPKYPQLDKDLIADVVVIGAGTAGLSIAYNLVKAGKKVVVLEKGARGCGQTGKSTGHVMLWNDDYYHNIEKVFSKDWAPRVAESHREAKEWIKNVIQQEGIDAGFKEVDEYLVAADDKEETAEKLKNEEAAAQRAGFTSAKIVDLGGDEKHGKFKKALRFPGSAELHPIKYVDGLAEAVTKHGGKIFELTRMNNVDGHKVHTRNGHTVTADAVVFASNNPVNKNLTVQSRQRANRSYVVGLKLEKGAIDHALYSDTSNPSYNARVESFDDHDVLIVGGADHRTGQKPDEYVDTYSHLEEWARSHWPQAGDVMYKWARQYYAPHDVLGLYGPETVDISGCHYVATGDSNQGLTGGAIAGLIISNLIVNGDHKWADMYNPRRAPPADLSAFVQLGSYFKTVAQGIINDVSPKPLKLEDVKPGDGAVISHNLKQIAVYRDEDGTAHTYTAICPHWKCETQWNPLDKTFDCPCHGSYFDRYGRCIQGPSREDLEALEW